MSFRKVIVVAGGGGFIGSHLVESLLENYDVICIDNFCTGTPGNLNSALRCSEAVGSKLFVLEEDVSSREVFEKVMKISHTEFESRSISAYLNFACPASPAAYQSDPVFTLDTCYLGTKNALKFAEIGTRVLHASTSEIYGDPEIHPQSEQYRGSVNTWGPRACYDEGKRVAETLCFESLMKEHDVRVVRIFNTYGPRMQIDDGRVVSNFVTQALQDRDITIYGDGSQTRSFCYVSDLVRGILTYLARDKRHNSPINLGNPTERTVKSVAELVVSMTESRSKICYEQLPQDDPKKRNPDIRLARDILKWNPEISFEEGIRRTVTYFRERLRNT